MGATSIGMRIRPAAAEDLAYVAEIERSAFTDPWSRASFANLLGSRQVYFAVGEGDDGAVMGYVVAWFVADEGEIANLAVTPGARGRGAGAALLDAAVRAAGRRRAASLYLEVRDSNAHARALYASRGFEQVGRRRNYYRRPVEDALVLRRALP